MKKLTALFSVLLMLLIMCPTTAFASESVVTDKTIEYFDDGSYIVTEITTSTISTFASKIVTKSKSENYYDNSGNIEWTATVTGTFSYNGTSATCENARVSCKIYNDDWQVASAVPSKSGNKAIGTFTIKRHNLGVVTKTVNRTITLTCSTNGVFS